MKRTVVTGFWLGLLGIAVSMVPMVDQVEAAPKAKQATKQIEIERLQDIDNPDAAFTVDLSVDRKDSQYKVGDPIVLSFKTNKDCRLTLFNVGTSGKVHVLFPNEHQQDNLVKAGTVYQVPAKAAKFRFKAQGPVGQDVIKAIATLEQVALVSDGAAKSSGGMKEIAGSQKDIAIEVQQALDPVDPKRWAEAERVISIVE